TKLNVWQWMIAIVSYITIINLIIKIIFGLTWLYVFSAVIAVGTLSLITFIISFAIILYKSWRK
ncbi:MAG TPA: hypothetical protein VK031_03875, partial [Tissierellaceae bacterium]|nr:hypothetical protein [Tissierellaceae bacterium]